jgi:hypothetical protein
MLKRTIFQSMLSYSIIFAQQKESKKRKTKQRRKLWRFANCALCCFAFSYCYFQFRFMPEFVSFFLPALMCRNCRIRILEAYSDARKGNSGKLSAKSLPCKKLSLKLLQCIAVDKRPLRLVDGVGFRNFCYALNTSFTVPSHVYLSGVSFIFVFPFLPLFAVFLERADYVAFLHFFRLFQKLLPACYRSVSEALRERLRSRGVEVARLSYIIENSLALTCDCWTDPILRAFVCITISYIDKNWLIHSELLNIRNCTDRHTGENLAEWIVGVLTDMKIDVR